MRWKRLVLCLLISPSSTLSTPALLQAPSDAFGREVSEESRGRARFGSTRMDGTKVDVPSIAVTIPGDKRLSVMSAAPDLQTPPNNGLLLPDRAGPLVSRGGRHIGGRHIGGYCCLLICFATSWQMQTSPGAESERKLSMTLFRQFDRTQSGELTREAFQDLCSMAGVPEDSPKVKEITSKNSVLTYKHFREALADDVETESRNAARARAKSVNHLVSFGVSFVVSVPACKFELFLSLTRTLLLIASV